MKTKTVLPVVFVSNEKTPKAFKHKADQVYGFMGKFDDFYPVANFKSLGGKLKSSQMTCPLFLNVTEQPIGDAYHLYVSPIRSKRTVMTIKAKKI